MSLLDLPGNTSLLAQFLFLRKLAATCGCSRAVTPCLSSCCYHDFVISVNFAKSLKFRDRRSFTSLASGSFHSRITATHWYASRISRTSPQSASVASRWCVRVCVVSSGSSGLHRLSKGFVGSSPCLRRRFQVRYTLNYLSRARPSGMLHGFPYC